MFKLDKEISLDVPAFLHWWWGELSFLVPGHLRKWLGSGEEFLIVTRQGEELEACLLNDGVNRPLGRFSLDEAGSQRRDKLFADEPDLAEARQVLRLHASHGLSRTLKLPLAAEENLNQVVGFEMDRLTPFKSDQVYFDARVSSRSSPNRQITVALWLTPRHRLDSQIEELSTWGWHPALVDLAGTHRVGSCNLLPLKYRPVPNPWPRYLNISLATLSLLLFILLAAMPAWVSYRQIDGLEQEVKRVSKIAREVDQLRQDADRLQQEALFLQLKKLTEPVVTDLLEELSQVIPDNTWLNGLQYNEHKIVIQGQSPSASSLIELIEASPHFRNTSFVSPVTKDMSNGLERFQIASEVVNGRFTENAHPPANK